VVLEALMGVLEVPSSMQGFSEFTPVCCITLEPLLWPLLISNLVETHQYVFSTVPFMWHCFWKMYYAVYSVIICISIFAELLRFLCGPSGGGCLSSMFVRISGHSVLLLWL